MAVVLVLTVILVLLFPEFFGVVVGWLLRLLTLVVLGWFVWVLLQAT